MPKQVEECVESVLDDNPGMDESRAWAICNAQFDLAVGEVATLADLDLDAAQLDTLAEADCEWTAVEGGWVNGEAGLAVYDPDAFAAEEQGPGFGIDVFRVVQPDDSDLDLDGDLMGVGVDFPNAGVYVDWRIDAWPDEEQLDEPHVSDYGSVADLEQATGGTVEIVEHIEMTDPAGD